jgi:hypothetical protein
MSFMVEFDGMYLTGDGTPLASDAYFQAVTEGMVDLNLSLRKFYTLTCHDIVLPEDPSSYFLEVATSDHKVADLFKQDRRAAVIREYFGD